VANRLSNSTMRSEESFSSPGKSIPTEDSRCRLFEAGSGAAPGRGCAEASCALAPLVPVAGLSDAPLRRAAYMEEFLRLRQVDHMTVTGAARALQKSPSLFSGQNSLLKRYQRGGLTELTQPRHDGAANGSDLSHRIEALGWFVSASRFLYFSAKRAVIYQRQSTGPPRCRRFPLGGTRTRPNAFSPV
jgi:hypothetical protein